MRRLLYFLFVIMATIACSESSTENGGNENENQKPVEQPQITLDATSSDFTTDGGSNVITFNSNVAWTAEVVNTRADAWCSINPTSGPAGTANITVTTKENDTPDDRTASIIIKAGAASKTINVSQKQKDALTITASKFEVDAEGGEITIEVKANIDFEYAIDETAKEWITYQTTRAMKTSTLVFKVAKNNEVEKRKGKIAIKSGDFNEVVTIYQAGEKPSIVITENEYVVSSNSETIAVEVTSNVDVTVEIPADVDWISENTTRATSTNTYRFDILPNESYDQRSAEIKFTNKANGLSETVSVVQTQKDALIVAKTNYYVGSNGGNIHIELGHNIDFDIEISDDWITKIDTRAFSTETLTFDVAKNRSYNSRKGTITFKSKDSSLTQTVEIFQSQRDALIISNNDIVVSDDGGIVEFNIQSNVNFSVSAPNVDWVRAITTRGLTTHTLQYEVDPNTSYDSREAKIIVTDTDNNKSETITIGQAQKDAIVLAKSMYEFDIDGGALDLEIQTNVDLNVTISDDAQSWIHQIETRGLETKTLYFNIDACDENTSRSATITITGGNATQEISIKQELVIPTNQIWYTSSSDEVVTPYTKNVFGSNIVSNVYENGKGVITFDNNVTSIGRMAFTGCSNLTSMIIPKMVTSIGDGAFAGCSSLTSITIPKKVSNIGNSAFNYCSSLTSITIPEGVTSIGDAVFEGCSSLTAIYGKNASADNRCWIDDGVLKAFAPSGLKIYTIPEGVSSINTWTFAGCSSLTSITIPKGVTSIKCGAFARCSSLTSINIPKGVTNIEMEAFYDCSSLTSIVIPEGIIEIEPWLFYNCTSLTSIALPKGLKSIYGEAFSGCTSLTTINIPEGVTGIGINAFRYCSSITNITIPDKVTSIGYMAFRDCTSLSEVYCMSTTPPNMLTNSTVSMAFRDNAPNRKIYVPSDAVDTYKAANGWKEYAKDIVGYDFSNKDAIVIAKDSYTVSNKGEEIEIEVGHNIDYNISIGVDWITQKQTRALETDKLIFIISENDGNERSGSIIFSSTDSYITQKVNITQYAKEEDKLVAVDLGLSVKWASCNVGASKPEEAGGYYAWGEIEEKNNYTMSTYKWASGSTEKRIMTKYCTDPYYGTADNKTILDLEDDVANVKLGENWRMPTIEEYQELYTKCKWEWTSVNGVNGYRVSGNGNSIFIPAAGCRYYDEEEIRLFSELGCYWSSSLVDNDNTCAWAFSFDVEEIYEMDRVSRSPGNTIRAVQD